MAYTFKFEFKEGEMMEADPTTWGDACWAKEQMEKTGITCSDVYLFEENNQDIRGES